MIEYAERFADLAALSARVDRELGTRGVTVAPRATPTARLRLQAARALDVPSERLLEAALAGAAP